MRTNNNGLIDSGAELFGDATQLASGQRASDGFAALADLEVYAITSYDVFGRGVLHVLIALVVLLAIIRGLISRFSGSSSFQRLQFVDKAGRVLIHFLLAFIVAFLSFDALRGM